MAKSNTKILVGDFETTVYKDQKYTEVWASALVEIGSENVEIFGSISETFLYLLELDEDLIIYYHNLKFDGTFWLYYLIFELKLKHALIGDSLETLNWIENDDMENNTLKYSISSRGQWYSITIKVNNHIIELRDSFKLIPSSVKKIGESFGTKHKKSSIEYTGYRYAGCEITDEEKSYIANDVLVVKEALEIMFEEGHKSLTIGSCCLSEYKRIIKNKFYLKSVSDFTTIFPLMNEVELDKDIYGYNNADAYIRESYKGGWCYLVKGKENQLFYKGITADVNSLYPSVMHSDSGNKYPIGTPTFWKGNFIPPVAKEEDKYFFIRVRCRFKLKEGMLPTVQIKHNIYYLSNMWLESSDFYVKKEDKYYRYLTGPNGEKIEAKPTLTFTCTDYGLFLKHYNVYDLEILDGCWFHAEVGLFDDYIDKYRKIKMESKGAIREIAKLFMNNLYGKLSTNNNSSFKLIQQENEDYLSFFPVCRYDKALVYIPAGSAVTSYARYFTITAAQNNYYGVDKPGFIYADTDSIHCNLSANELKGIPVHPNEFLHWKLEGQWDYAIFVRQKTYIEHIIGENLEPVDEPYHNIKCAGMPEHCKWQLGVSFDGLTPEEIQEKYPGKWEILSDEEKDFILQKRTYKDFKIGLKIFGKLMPVQIKGGTVLLETTYEIR